MFHRNINDLTVWYMLHLVGGISQIILTKQGTFGQFILCKTLNFHFKIQFTFHVPMNPDNEGTGHFTTCEHMVKT